MSTSSSSKSTLATARGVRGTAMVDPNGSAKAKAAAKAAKAARKAKAKAAAQRGAKQREEARLTRAAKKLAKYEAKRTRKENRVTKPAVQAVKPVATQELATPETLRALERKGWLKRYKDRTCKPAMSARVVDEEKQDVLTEAELQLQEFNTLLKECWKAREFADWVDAQEWYRPTLWMNSYQDWLEYVEPLWATVDSFEGDDMRLNDYLTGSYGAMSPKTLKWLGSDIPDFEWISEIHQHPPVDLYESGLEAYAAFTENPQIRMTKNVRKVWKEKWHPDYTHNARLWVYALQLLDPNLIVRVLNEAQVPYPKGTSCHCVATLASWVGMERFINLICKPQTRTSVEEVNGEMVRREVPVEDWFVKDIAEMVKIYDQAQTDWVQGKLLGVKMEELTPTLGRIRSLQQLHNELAPQAVAVQKEVTLHQEDIADFDGEEFEGYTIVVPTSSRQIALWGKLHHHCVGTYTKRINDYGTKVFGLFQSEELVWTGSIVPQGKDWWLEQLMGPYNSPAPNELQAAVAKLFEVMHG